MKSRTIKVNLDEAREVFLLLEEFQQFFHQPMHYENIAQVNEFLEKGAFDRLCRAYYDVTWNWLPEDVQKEIEDRSPLDEN